MRACAKGGAFMTRPRCNNCASSETFAGFFQTIDLAIDLRALRLDGAEPFLEERDGKTVLLVATSAALIEIEYLADFVKRQPHLASTQNELESGTVTLALAAGCVFCSSARAALRAAAVCGAITERPVLAS